MNIQAVMVLHCNSFLWWKVVDFSVNKREQKAFVKWLLLQRIFQHFHFKVHFVKAYSHINVIFVGSCRAKSSFKNKNQNSSKLAQLFLSPRYETVHKRSLGTLFFFLRIFNMSFQRQGSWFTYVRPFKIPCGEYQSGIGQGTKTH